MTDDIMQRLAALEARVAALEAARVVQPYYPVLPEPLRGPEWVPPVIGPVTITTDHTTYLTAPATACQDCALWTAHPPIDGVVTWMGTCERDGYGHSGGDGPCPHHVARAEEGGVRMSTTAKAPRTRTNCARVRVVGKTTLHYECCITRDSVGPDDTCECWKKRRKA